MKFLLTALLATCWLSGFAQTDPSIPQPDDEFNLFLLVLGTAFFAMVIGAVLLGALVATFFLLILLALVSAGVLSAGILVGLYKRSLMAGFRTMVVMASTIGAIALGTISFWMINRIFHLHLTPPTAALVGAFGGLLSGLLLGFALSAIIRIFINHCRRKLSF